MKVKDLMVLSDKTHHRVAYELNITYHYLSSIKNRRIGNLSRDLQLKIELFRIKNKDVIDQKIMEISKYT